MGAGNAGARDSGVEPAALWDGPRFGAWLRRWKEAEGLAWTEIKQRGGMGSGVIEQFARGTPSARSRKRGIPTTDPRINSVARVAHGLGLDFAYIASKGGLAVEAGTRWARFTGAERAALAAALRASPPGADRDRLLGELE